MAACLQLNAKPLRTLFSPNPIFTKSTYKLGRIRCSAASPSKRYTITLLPGDGIGPEVISVAKNVLNLAATTQGIEFKYQEMPVGGNALDLTGVPLPEETLLATQQSDAVLLGAIGGYKWDKNEKHLKPETGLLKLREGLKVFANLRPAVVLHQLVDASSLKREIAEGVDLMVIRELTGGIYFGQPRGFGTNEDGEEIGFNTEVYAAYEIDRIARVAFETARKRNGKLCSVDKANVLEVEVCRILFTVDVQYTGSIEHAQSSSYSSTQQRPVCLGMHSKIHKEYFNVKIMIRLLLVILFFFLIFFYRETRPRLEWNSHNYLQSFFSLLLHIKMDRLFMAFVIHERCRNTQVLDAHEGDFVHYQFILGHAISKLRCKEAEHCYSLEMETRRDYAGDNYVHRLIQSKTDGKLVELNSHCRNANNVKGSCECVDSGFSEALLNSKVDTIVNEYNKLLATQLEIQKTYFESLLQEVKEGTERKISKAVEKAVPLKKMQDKLDRCVKEKKFLYDLNVNLLKNREAWKTKIHEVEERERSASKLKDDKISSLEGQLRDLMLYLETWNAVERQSLSNETIDATILPVLINSLQPSMVR